jgi:hypothetical protein
LNSPGREPRGKRSHTIFKPPQGATLNGAMFGAAPCGGYEMDWVLPSRGSRPGLFKCRPLRGLATRAPYHRSGSNRAFGSFSARRTKAATSFTRATVALCTSKAFRSMITATSASRSI